MSAGARSEGSVELTQTGIGAIRSEFGCAWWQVAALRLYTL